MELKIAFLIILVSVSNVLAIPTYSQVAKVSLDLKNTSLEQVMDEIEKQSEFYFVFNQKQIDINRTVDIQAENKLITDILPELFKGTNVNYILFDKKILLTTDTLENDLLAIASGTKPQQEVTVRGTVTDATTGEALAGVNIRLKTTLIGVNTDMEGRYTVNVPDGNGILVFSFIGFTSQEITVNGRSTIDVKLSEKATTLDEVVITALGIKKEARTLGYSTSTVVHNEITDNRTTSTLGTLQGKLSGVNISSPMTGPEGASKIRIRGQSSFNGTNTPLIVVDGMPIDNTSHVRDARDVESSRSDGGDGLSSINPDDIVTMTVLKGAAASALYGSRAKDGVIMITTKNRGDNKGIGVDYNINFVIETPLDFTDFQYEYGQGERGIRPTTAYPTSGIWSFGEKFEPGMTQVLFDGVVVPYEPVYNRVKTFYDTGNNLTNTLTLSNNGENGGFNLSFSNTDIKSIVPNSDFNRKTINLGFTQTISKNLTVEGTANYSNEYNRNPAQIGGQQFSTTASVFTIANSMPFDLLKKYMVDANGNEFVWSRFLSRTNPYFSVYKHFENIKRDRIMGNLSIKYQFTDWLYLQGRIAQDYYVRFQDYNKTTGYAALSPAPAGFVNGSYTQEEQKFRERNYDFLLSATQKIGDFGVDITLGGNQMYRRLDYNSVAVMDFVQRDLYTITNGRTKDPLYSLNERAVNSLYGTAELSFRNYLFLVVTGRNDWFSTLAPARRSIFYPSVTGSFVFSDALKNTMPKWLTFGKLRAAYAQVGDDNVAAYSNALYYKVNNNLFANPQGQLIPVGSIMSSTIPNGDLRPLRVSEVEVGMDLRLFDNVIGFDLSFYHKITRDQIVSAQISNTSSYTSQLINVGRSMNKGIEMTVTATPIKTTSFSWDLTMNGSYNTSKVLQLGVNVADTMISVGGIREIVGRPMGQMYEYMYLRDDEGRQVFNKVSGFPMRSNQLVNVGSNQPNYFGGITNTFNYKGISLSALITFKLGKNFVTDGVANRNYWRHGLHKGTLPGRDVGYVIGDGVNEDGQVNTTKAEVQPFYESVHGLNINEPFITNAGFWKLSQVCLSYDFSKLLPEKFFLKGLRFSLVSNNVAVLKKWTVNMDPEETFDFSDNDAGFTFSSLPITRSMGFNLNVKF